MMTDLQLQALLRSSETHWVERKTSYDRSEVMRTVVAFANSLPEDQQRSSIYRGRPGWENFTSGKR